MLLDIMDEEEEELEKEEDTMEDLDMEEEEEPMEMDPMSPIILLIMLSMSRLGMPPPPPKRDGMPPPKPDIMRLPPGMGPPEDIIVEEDEEEDVDLKLEVVDPSGDCVTAAMLWLLAFSSFFTAVPSSVTKAWLWAFMASEICAPSGAVRTRGALTVRIPLPE